MKLRLTPHLLATLLGVALTATVHAQSTAFTYQGRLTESGIPATGLYDLQFTIYDADTNGSVVAGPITNSPVMVSNGLFTTTLDFGSGVFDGGARWLGIGVRTNLTGSYNLLSPRQELTPTPYAITAGNLMGGGLPATYASAVNFNNAANSFTGSGAGLTSLNANNLASGTVPDARLSANVALLDRNQTFTGNQTFAGQVYLPSPVATIYSGGTTVLHSDFNNANFFVGRGAGNLIVSGTGNTAVGEDALISDLSGGGNVADGFEALYDNTSGSDNTAGGTFALQANTSGSYNTANGAHALYANTSGYYNTANGFEALYVNTSGSFNTANGMDALYANTIGSDNVANGVGALQFNKSGSNNVANGNLALSSNSTGHENTANGSQALYANTNGTDNTANGAGAMFNNTSGSYNTANGYDALRNNIDGQFNAANGAEALFSNTGGSNNVANGYQALFNNTTGAYNTANGFLALNHNTSGAFNVALGNGAGENITTGSLNIDLSNSGQASDFGIIRIGAQDIQTSTFIAGIYGATAASGVPVYVTSSGQLGTLTSSRRFKQDIHKMGDASDVLYSLKPVTFQYKPGIDPQGTPQFGLVAEQVEKVDPTLVVRDKTGQPYTVRYQAVDAMLLNEFLKEHKKVQEQSSEIKAQGGEIQQLKQTMAELKAMVGELAATKGNAQ